MKNIMFLGYDSFETRLIDFLQTYDGIIDYAIQENVDLVLFAGDALAVVNDRIRFMARPVTPDLDRARTSMKKCLSFDVNVLCPGHRVPLVKDVPRCCDEMLDYLDSAGRWPLLG